MAPLQPSKSLVGCDNLYFADTPDGFKELKLSRMKGAATGSLL